MSSDGQQAWEMTALFSAGWAAALVFGRLPSRGYWIKRREKPGLFWFGMTTYGAFCLGLAWWALYLTLPPA